MYNSEISLSVEPSYQCEYKEIIYKIQNIIHCKIYSKFKKFLKNGENQIFENKTDNNIFLNYKNLIRFLETIKENIRKKLYDKSLTDIRLLIKLKISDSGENPGNISNKKRCEFILQNPNFVEINENKYIEDDILIKQKYDVFESFISEIIQIKLEEINNQETGPFLSSFSNLTSINMNSNNNYSSISKNATPLN